MVIKHITGLQPNQSFNVDGWDIPQNIVLSDPTFNRSSKIDLLIGAEYFFELLSIGQIKMEGRPTLQKTLFGWVVSGRYDRLLVPNATVCLVSSQEEQDNLRLNEIVEQFWNLEKVDSQKAFLSAEEERSEDHFVRNVVRGNDGRFVVRLPFKENPDVLGDSLSIAKKRFFSLERRLDRTRSQRTILPIYEGVRKFRSHGRSSSTQGQRDEVFLPTSMCPPAGVFFHKIKGCF